MELKLDAVTDFLNEQEWFRQVKSKWEELDPQSKFYLKIAGAAAGVLFFLFLVLNSLWSVHSLKEQLAKKEELLELIQSANDEIHGLRASGVPTEMASQTGPWNTYFETVATNSGIDKDNLTVSAEKEGPPGDLAKESLFDLSLKKSSIRQAVKYAYFLENGQRPVKLRNFSIDTHADPAGYVDATLAVSAFTPREEKSKGGR